MKKASILMRFCDSQVLQKRMSEGRKIFIDFLRVLEG